MRAILLLLSTLTAVQAAAVEPLHQAAPAPVSFRRHRQLFDSHGFDTGWRPATGPIQVRFVGAVGAQVDAFAPGSVRLGWGLQPALWAEGDPLGGRLSMDMGAEFRGLLRLDLPLPTGGHLRWEGTLPSVFNLDFRFADSEPFTPFLFVDQTPSSAQIADDLRDTILVSVPLTEAFLPIPGVGGYFDVTGSGSLETTLRDGELVFPEGTLERLDAPLGWTVPAEPIWRSSATYQATADTRGALELEPRVSIRVGPLVWRLAGLPIPIPLPRRSDRWTFDAQAVAIDLPRLAIVELDGAVPVRASETEGYALDFGDGPLHQRAEKPVRVANVGRAPLEGTLRVEGAGFAATSAAPISLAPGESAVVSVGFDRPGVGTFRAAARFESNDPLGATELSLRGSARAPEELLAGEGGTGPEDSASAGLEGETGPEGSGAQLASPASGCGCATAQASPALTALLAALGLALRRRPARG